MHITMVLCVRIEEEWPNNNNKDNKLTNISIAGITKKCHHHHTIIVVSINKTIVNNQDNNNNTVYLIIIIIIIIKECRYINQYRNYLLGFCYWLCCWVTGLIRLSTGTELKIVKMINSRRNKWTEMLNIRLLRRNNRKLWGMCLGTWITIIGSEGRI